MGGFPQVHTIHLVTKQTGFTTQLYYRSRQRPIELYIINRTCGTDHLSHSLPRLQHPKFIAAEYSHPCILLLHMHNDPMQLQFGLTSRMRSPLQSWPSLPAGLCSITCLIKMPDMAFWLSAITLNKSTRPPVQAIMDYSSDKW